MAVAVYPINIDSRVSDFIAKPRQMMIDGKWVYEEKRDEE